MQQPTAEFDQTITEPLTFSVAEPTFFDRMSFNFKQRQNIQKAMQDRYEQYGAVVRSGFLGTFKRLREWRRASKGIHDIVDIWGKRRNAKESETKRKGVSHP